MDSLLFTLGDMWRGLDDNTAGFEREGCSCACVASYSVQTNLISLLQQPGPKRLQTFYGSTIDRTYKAENITALQWMSK